jgi:hypothetical protein
VREGKIESGEKSEEKTERKRKMACLSLSPSITDLLS